MNSDWNYDGDAYWLSTDCDDGDGGINPNAAEKCECDTVDQNCNGSKTDLPDGCDVTCQLEGGFTTIAPVLVSGALSCTISQSNTGRKVAIDSLGNVYVAMVCGGNGYVAISSDRGQTYGAPVDLGMAGINEMAIAPATTTALTGTWAAPGSFTASFAGVPASVTSLRLSHLAYADGAPLSSNLEVLPAATAGATGGTYAHPAAVGDASLDMYYLADVTGGFQRVARYAAPATTLVVPDLAAAVLPTVELATPPSGATPDRRPACKNLPASNVETL